jgi:type IV secretory pathway VirB10-like protein
VEEAEYAEPEAEPAPRKPRRPRKPRPGLWRALIAVGVVAVAGGAYWWFQPQLPSLTVPQVLRELPARAGELGSRVKALASRVKDLPFLKPRPAASKPPAQRQPRTPAPASPRPQPPAPPPPRAAVPVAPTAPAPAFERLGDAVGLAVRRFNDRAAQFDRHEVTCADLARELGAVERDWVAYSAARRAAGVLDAAHAARDQSLYAGVDAAAHRLEKAGCERQPTDGAAH